MQARVKALYLHRGAVPVYHVEITLSLSLKCAVNKKGKSEQSSEHKDFQGMCIM